MNMSGIGGNWASKLGECGQSTMKDRDQEGQEERAGWKKLKGRL